MGVGHVPLSCTVCIYIYIYIYIYTMCIDASQVSGSSRGEVTGCSSHPCPKTSVSTVDELEICAACNLYKIT